MSKVYNFSAGPAVLPAAVMRQAQEQFTNYQGLGYGIMEASHRSPEFDEIIVAAEANIRQLMGVPDDYAVLFLQGGASTQFAMIPMNLMKDGGSADYADTGSWSSKAIKEAKRFGKVSVVTSSKDSNYNHIPEIPDDQLDAEASYLHITSNNTIFGTEYFDFPTPPEGVPLIADMSSDIMSHELDVSQFGLIYAGAQKNLGPSGVTLVIMRKELAERAPDSLTTMLRYDTHIGKDSMFNTPPTFSIYMVRLVTDWLKEQGGIAAMERVNKAKAKAVYDVIDAEDFYQCPTEPASRSRMNVCFTIDGGDLEKQFIKEAAEEGLVGLKGHRSVGGMRASIYNAMPAEGVHALIGFMKDFRSRNG